MNARDRYNIGGMRPYGYDEHMFFTYTNDTGLRNWGVWHLHVAESGDYQVYAYIPDHDADSKKAKYIIHHNNRNDYSTVDQDIYFNEFVSLGTFHFNASNDQYIRLDDNTGEDYGTYRRRMGFNAIRLGFDAIKLVPVCTSHASKKCSNNDLYWYDSCGNRQDRYSECSDTNPCTNDSCNPDTGCINTPVDGCCTSDDDCAQGSVCQNLDHYCYRVLAEPIDNQDDADAYNADADNAESAEITEDLTSRDQGGKDLPPVDTVMDTLKVTDDVQPSDTGVHNDMVTGVTTDKGSENTDVQSFQDGPQPDLVLVDAVTRKPAPASGGCDTKSSGEHKGWVLLLLGFLVLIMLKHRKLN